MLGLGSKTASKLRVTGRVLTGVLVFALLQVSPNEAASVSSPRYWIATRKTIASISSADGALAQRVFRAPFAYALGGGWGQAVPAEGYASFASFEEALARGAAPGRSDSVMYDPERWPFTGVKERKEPIRYMGAFARAAQQAGYELIEAPSPSLMLVPGASCGVTAGESEYSAFLRCGIPAHAAVGADIFDVQAQRLERYPSRYGSFVAQAASQARSANPGIVILADLSTSPGYPVTARMLYSAWKAVSGVADGIYLAIPQGRNPKAAVIFLGFLAPAG